MFASRTTRPVPGAPAWPGTPLGPGAPVGPGAPDGPGIDWEFHERAVSPFKHLLAMRIAPDLVFTHELMTLLLVADIEGIRETPNTRSIAVPVAAASRFNFCPQILFLNSSAGVNLVGSSW